MRMVGDLLKKFASSGPGEKALEALASKAGLSKDDAEKVLHSCHGVDCSGDNPLANLAAEKLAAHVADKTGLSRDVAERAAKALSPVLTDYVSQHVGGKSADRASKPGIV